MATQDDMFYAVVITGTSRETTEEDVRKFFSESKVKEIILPGGGTASDSDWRTNSSIFVRLETLVDFESACRKDGHILRSQKVGVLTLTKKDYDRVSGGGVTQPPSYVPPLAMKNEPLLYPSNTQQIAPPPPLSVNDNEPNMVRLRGLPYSAMASDILDFLKDVNVLNGEKGVHFSFGYDGRVSGEAYVQVCTPEDIDRALKFDRCHLGGRYIEIFRASQSQFEWDCRPAGFDGSGGSKGGVVRLRGLPYGCSREDIRDFLQGIAIVEGGITMQTNENGRETGEAFVELVKEDDVERALDRHKKLIGHRYIEVFRTTHGDIKPVADRWAKYSRPAPYPGAGGRGRGGGGGYYDHDPYHRGAGYKFGGGRGGGGSWGNYEQERTRYMGGANKYGPPHQDTMTPYYQDRFSSQPGGSDHMVRLRGVPYSTTEQDIYAFFSPLVPLSVNLNKDHFGRALGEGEVFFQSHDDAQLAMKKDRQNIGSRYVELFLHSTPGPSFGGGGNWNNQVDHPPMAGGTSTGGIPPAGGAGGYVGPYHTATYYVPGASGGGAYTQQVSGGGGGGWYQ